jgi:hypothetical protein
MAFADFGPQGGSGLFDDMLASPPQNGGAALPGMFDDLIPESGAAPGQPGMFDDLIANAPAGQIATQTQQTTPQHHFGLMDTWPVRLAKSVYDAVTLPHDFYQGTATVPQSANFSGGEDTSSIGRMTNLAALTALPNEAGGGPTNAAPPTLGQLKSAAQTGYNAANRIGIELRPQALNSFNVNLQAKLAEDGLNAEVARLPTPDRASGELARIISPILLKPPNAR